MKAKAAKLQELGWRVWYDDGEVFKSDTYGWADLADDGILVRMIYYGDGTKQIQHGMDYYYEAPHEEGTIRGTGNDLDDILIRYPDAIIKRGRWTPDEYYRETVEESMKMVWGP